MSAPYPSPVLSEEEDILLDSPALEVSDSESDEALLAGSEGRGSEAGMCGGELVGMLTVGRGRGWRNQRSLSTN